MDNFGDILYILAMIAAFVYSVYKKQKKAKNNVPTPQDANQPQYNDTKEGDILEELKELLQQKEKKHSQPPVEKKAPLVVPLHMQAKRNVKKTVTLPKQNFMEDNPIEAEEIGIEFDKEQIDLRQAVIYSEILKRPYQ